ncbi:Tautomerase-3 domain-containing protein [Aphelenchoides besseyi]|nr:Tautomerase-3 domain-containing protein [Aphelenchoides besseyi]
MPFHRFFHTPGTFTQADKDEIAHRVTKIYTDAGLAPFYTIVVFIPVEASDFYVGGKQNAEKFVRIGIQHIARHFASPVEVQRFFDLYDKAVVPYIKERGLEYEIAVDESDFNLVRQSGHPLPIANSKAEKKWARLNKAVPYTDEENTVEK